jgi:hypothetical protein
VVGSQLQTTGARQLLKARPIRNGGGFSSAKDPGTHGHSNLIDKVRAEHGIVQRATALANETANLPFATQPFQRRGQIQFPTTKDSDFIRDGLQLFSFPGRGSFRCEEEDR